ncbi:MAG: hypothetical protein WKF75_01775, partial [Singulisphaera sp.]
WERRMRYDSRRKGPRLRPEMQLLEVRALLSGDLRFDFGTAGSPVSAGYAAVAAATAYDPARGFGWLDGGVEERDRGAGPGPDPALTRDLNFTARGTFAVDLPAGTYRVAVTLGDPDYAHARMAVAVAGGPAEEVSTAAGQLVTRVYTVAVSGRLEVGWRGGGGYSYAVIAALDIALADDDAVGGLGVGQPGGRAPSPTIIRGTRSSPGRRSIRIPPTCSPASAWARGCTRRSVRRTTAIRPGSPTRSWRATSRRSPSTSRRTPSSATPARIRSRGMRPWSSPPKATSTSWWSIATTGCSTSCSAPR